MRTVNAGRFVFVFILIFICICICIGICICITWWGARSEFLEPIMRTVNAGRWVKTAVWKSAAAKISRSTCFHAQNVIFNLQKNMEKEGNMEIKMWKIWKNGKVQPQKHFAELAFTHKMSFSICRKMWRKKGYMKI